MRRRRARRISFLFDLVRLAGGGEGFATAAFYMIAAGILGGLAAAVFGLVDFLAIPRGTRAKSVGAFHGVANVVVVGLFIASWGIRAELPLRTPRRREVVPAAPVPAAAGLMTSRRRGPVSPRAGVRFDLRQSV